MALPMRIVLVTSLLTLLGLGGQPMASAEISENLLKNPSFEEGVAGDGVPTGWDYYQAPDALRKIEIVEPGCESAHALLIRDDDPQREIGVSQAVPADGGLTYEAAVMVYVPEGATAAGAYIQLRFNPGDVFEQRPLAVPTPGRWTRVAVVGTAPEGARSARIVLYTHRTPTPRVILDAVSLVSGVEPPPPPPPPPPPVPEPVPPQYDTLKDLCLDTELVRDGQANCLVVKPTSGRYDRQAEAIVGAIERITGVEVSVIGDDDSAAAVPITGNLICLGNRSTNTTIEELYNRYYTLLDLRYPGAGGYEVRTLHNPFGDGHNVVFAGGSDDAGVARAAEVLIQRLEAAGGGRGALTVGRIAEVKLGDGIEVPRDINALEIWEASKGYGSTGYFGWCSISKRLAAYYVTGDEFHAREFLRLAFPDAQALKDIADVDGERIENKDDPLAGFYHYNAHMAILFWDLVEESPFFDDATRLKVTNAFARQLNHRKDEGVYRLNVPARAVGSRHGQYSAISLFCLGRYFDTYYPDPIWEQCVRGAWNHFASLGEYAWVSGEADNLFWYTTGTAPILSWMMLSGDRRPIEAGTLDIQLRAQDALVTGQRPDWALNSAAIDYLHKCAYVTGDGRWLEYLDRTGIDLSLFRLGQSYWPDESIRRRMPTELVGRWTIHPLSLPMWQSRGSGLPFEQSFQWGSFRSAPDASGDFILLDGYNGASRNPYHTFAVLELRMDGATLLKGYRNQVLTKADGMVEHQVAMDGALQRHDMLGGTAVAVGDVPKAAFCDWQRSLVQRVGRYALVVDDLAFRTASDNIEVQVLWETVGPKWDPQRNLLSLTAARRASLPRGWFGARALDAQCSSEPAGAEFLVPLDSINIMLLRATEPGSWLEVPFELPRDLEGDIFVDMVDYLDRGVVRFLLDGEPIGDEHPHFAEAAQTTRLSLGRRTLAAGEHRLRAEVVRLNPGAPRSNVGLGGVLVRPVGAPDAEAPALYAIATSKPVNALRSGAITTMQWFGAVQADQHVRFFSVLGSDDGDQLVSYELAPNAAALRIPEPALAVVGSYGATDADLAVLAEDHLYAHGMLAAGGDEPLIYANERIAIDWDFATGAMHLVTEADTTSLMMRLADAQGARLNGQGISLRPGDGGMLSLDLPAGRHVLEGLRPATGLAEALAARLEQGARLRAEQLAAAAAGEQITAPELTAAAEAQVGGAVLQMLTIPEGDGELACVAEGQTVHLLDATGRQVRALQADGPVRVIHWWAEQQLLLVGCEDEQVIAFDRSGQRKWVFVSEMDPAVFRAAKTYWFKSAEVHKGIWGVTSGRFINDQEQAIIGSACTLEFVDGAGKLVHRMPQFWGDPHVFQFIPQADGSINLLAARRINGSDTLGIINNRTLNPGVRGFHTVPPGHTSVGGWSSMNRYHILHEDLDGDGVREVISEKNGSWNRVTVWDEAGNAKWDASFGPGTDSPSRNMRDLLVADLDGDGKLEIVTATSAGLVVALTYDCQKLWSKRLLSPPNVMRAFIPAGGQTPWLMVGCDDGSVLVLDGTGEVVRTAQFDSQVRDIVALAEGAAPLAMLGSARGQVATFQVR